MGDRDDRELTIEEVRERYRIEKEKRLRVDANDQYKELKGTYVSFDHDPYAEPLVRDPLVEEVEVVVLGAGFGGMLAAVELSQRGVDDFRIIEKAGDFGGTWYWNRYPGCMCDVESYTYLPLLEETGYMPTERYASASEIFGYCQLLGRHFDLYRRALFQTVITGIAWDGEAHRWQVSTSRGDRIAARFVVLAGGILHKAKLPGIPGIEEFQGKTFHTSRWDYEYTGGSNREPLVGLRDKRVGIIGTGATAIQAVPRLAASAGELFVFQRTPSAVGVRGNRPTDVEWFKSLQPGWQRERVHNFTHAVVGDQPGHDMVDDGWTHAMWVDTKRAGRTPEEAAALEAEDLQTMEGFRRRIDELVHDPETAAKLKPWYGKNCKRLCFHDEYLQSFNRPNVHLVDTDGRGVERVTARGVVVDGVEHELDCLIFASGFEVSTDYDRRLGFDPVGRDGVTLSSWWAKGPRTMHGVLVHGFPNMFMMALTQASFGTNFVHYLGQGAEHVADVIATCEREGVVAIEPTPDAEEDWLMVLYGAVAGMNGEYYAGCTPGYYTSEQAAPDERTARNVGFPSLLDWAAALRTWREAGDLAGTRVARRGPR
jgi:cation diffusion facilitator CzcD-associated flavoprotein CzcO